MAVRLLASRGPTRLTKFLNLQSGGERAAVRRGKPSMESVVRDIRLAGVPRGVDLRMSRSTCRSDRGAADRMSLAA